jgi:phage shock protein A
MEEKTSCYNENSKQCYDVVQNTIQRLTDRVEELEERMKYVSEHMIEMEAMFSSDLDDESSYEDESSFDDEYDEILERLDVHFPRTHPLEREDDE